MDIFKNLSNISFTVIFLRHFETWPVLYKEPEITFKSCPDKTSDQNKIWSGISKFDLLYTDLTLRCVTLCYVLWRYNTLVLVDVTLRCEMLRCEMLRCVVRCYAALWDVTLWDVTLRCEILRCVARCCVVRCYAALWDVTLRCEMLRGLVRCYAALWDVTLWDVTLWDVALWDVTLRCEMLRCEMLRYVVRCCEMLRYVEIRYAFKQKVLSCFGALISIG